ncbi:DUF6988 family protein [Cupriavidus necator]|uniref:DUF6988 family protein n=1 Tax=Cupriavidus necator TaxID=106590 RepID=UPI003F50944C
MFSKKRLRDSSWNPDPRQLAIDALRNSNALVCIAAQLASILCDPENPQPVRQLHIDFADCVPLSDLAGKHCPGP